LKILFGQFSFTLIFFSPHFDLLSSTQPVQ